MQTMSLRAFFALLASFAFVNVAAAAPATLKLPAIFSDHMVVQAGKPVIIWGWAGAGEEVTVSLAGQSQTTQTKADGTWKVSLGKVQSSAQPQTLTVKGGTTLTVNDVLIGEVWLASGQAK